MKAIILLFSIFACTLGVANSNLVPDTTILPKTDSSYSVKILIPGTYKLNEINYDANTMDWFALVSNGVSYSIKKIRPDHSKVKDSVTGEEMHLIKGDDSLNTILMFSGVNMLEQEVYDMKMGVKSFKNGDRLEYNYNGKKFLLTAESVEEKDKATKKKYQARYKLFFSPLKKEKTKQLIAYHKKIEDAYPTVIFVGDMDNDKIPDLILNNTNKTGDNHLVLYLSNNPKKGTFYKTMGVFNYTK